MDEIAKFISSVGFPIAITVYVLVRMEKTMQQLSNSINKLTILLTKQAGSSDDSN